MKSQPFLKRLSFAIAGIRSAFSEERSFRTQIFGAVFAAMLLFAVQPKPIWWAMVSLAAFAVLGAELINTALEALIDHLHPNQHPAMGLAKDCAAGAVLLFSIAALIVALAMLWDTYF
jgi:undecaprenol kinase